MELKKCARCGCFFSSPASVCSSCEVKDKQDISKLNNYIASSEVDFTVDSLSYSTGIASKNVARFIENKDIVEI